MKIIQKIKIPNKKKLTKSTRISIIALIGFIVIFSTCNVYAVYQEPTTSREKIPTVTYQHKGSFDYDVYLINNTVYDAEILKPGEGIYFKQIVDYIDTYFTYTFESNKDADISGDYTIKAQIQTDIWTKTYTIVTKTPFNATGKSATFTKKFPMEYADFEGIVAQINEEIGVNSGNPTLIITCDITISADTTEDTIISFFSPSITVSLNKKIIEISDILSITELGRLTKTITDSKQSTIEQRNNWTLTSSIFFIILVAFSLFTTSDYQQVDETEKMMKKIHKKYGDWIVETNKQPTITKKGTISLNSLEDLVKIGDELGKPLLHYRSKSDEEENRFYVIDQSILYEYNLKIKEKIQKIAPCPDCGTKILCKGYNGEKISVRCPKCGTRGIVPLVDKNGATLLKRLVNRFYKNNL